MTGTVKWFDSRKGYGFIAGDDGNDIFVHYSALQMDGFKKVRTNDKVEYDASSDANGKPIAVNVRVATA